MECTHQLSCVLGCGPAQFSLSIIFRRAEAEFLKGSGVFAGSVRHLPESDRAEIVVQAMSSEAVTTSEIEGEILHRASVQSSIRRQLRLMTGRRRIGPAEEVIAEMMIDLYRTFSEPLSEATLCGWHRTRAISEKALAQAVELVFRRSARETARRQLRLRSAPFWSLTGYISLR